VSSALSITTIQRLYAMLKGEELDPALEEQSGFEGSLLLKEPAPVAYNPSLPVETFDFIVTDECHRSIYNLWRQVLEYFDAFIIGPTDKRDKLTRKVRWQQLDEDLSYAAKQLDRDVVAKDQIRTIIQAFHDRLFTEIFPGRTEVPKTLIFAKDDSHADDIVQIVREEFGKGNDFAQKITYRTGTARVVSKKMAEDG
jgi:type I restriction enzyme R subunit